MGEELNVQEPASCVIWTLWPATDTDVALDCVVGLAVAFRLTVPEPEPLAPVEIVNHEAPDVAVHEQPASVVTPTDAAPPAAGVDCVAGDRLYEQLLPG